MPDSPLVEVVKDQRIDRLLRNVGEAVRNGHSITIHPRDVDYIRRRFTPAISLGEKKLYDLARVFLEHFASGRDVGVSLIVWGRCATLKHRDEVRQEHVDFTGQADAIFATSDTLIAEEHAPVCKRCGRRMTVIASYVRYEPEIAEENSLLFLLTRVKATSNICYKIADLVFEIDWLFQRDKIYHDYNQMVTDVYGIKPIVRSDDDVRAVPALLSGNPEIEVVGEKDYTGIHKKKSGFEALKTVVRWQGQVFEVQTQSLRMYEFEQSNRTASHQTYKERLMADRRKLGREYVKVYELLKSLLMPAGGNYSDIVHLELSLSGKGLDDEF